MDTIGFIQSLKVAVLRHQHLISYTDIIENSFNQTLLMHVIGTSVILCLQGYQFVTVISENGEKLLVNLVYIVIFMTSTAVSVFMYCYFAQIIRDESDELHYAIYEMKWYELADKDAVLVVVIMGRCMLPIKITVGKFADFTLEYFAKIMKTSMGYLTVLLAVKKQID
ncbi:odorant receptor coreceptor-like [Phymastichus coffea]|uniref:odorant receptor coreceptor-like n=1 Tax=Phymastichus coffea TaxID=108790 RepID=UPI00273A7DDF|nr:odorant receptor coreceptor-like [Phymastichus coffea]